MRNWLASSPCKRCGEGPQRGKAWKEAKRAGTGGQRGLGQVKGNTRDRRQAQVGVRLARKKNRKCTRKGLAIRILSFKAH